MSDNYKAEFSVQFWETLDMLESLSKYPLLVEGFVRSTAFNDLNATLRMHIEDMEG